MSDDKEAQKAEQAAFEVARIGIALEQFVHTKEGKYLIAKADREFDEAAKDLINTPAKDHEAIAEAQVKARVAVKFKKWVVEGIHSGQAAQTFLTKLDQQEGVA